MENVDEGVVVEPSISIEPVANFPHLLSLDSKNLSEMAMGSSPGEMPLTKSRGGC